MIWGGERVGRPDGHDARAELDADRHIVVGHEAALAQPDRERRFTAPRIAYAYELCDVVPGRGRHGRCCDRGREGEGPRVRRLRGIGLGR